MRKKTSSTTPLNWSVDEETMAPLALSLPPIDIEIVGLAIVTPPI